MSHIIYDFIETYTLSLNSHLPGLSFGNSIIDNFKITNFVDDDLFLFSNNDDDDVQCFSPFIYQMVTKNAPRNLNRRAPSQLRSRDRFG